jgi:ATP-dependent DNA helicase RecG
MITLTSPISSLTKVTKPTTKALASKGVNTVQDLLFYFPYRYLDFSIYKPIKEVKAGDTVTVRGKIKSIGARFSFRGRMSIAEAVVSDDTGSLKVVWFNQGYLAKTLQTGDDVLLAGTVSQYKTLQLQNPIYEKFNDDSTHTGRLVPVYRLTDNLYNRTLRNLVKQCLSLANRVEDIIPANTIKQFELMPLAETIHELHFPTSEVQLKAAQKRIIFDEVFIQQLAVQQHKQQLALSQAPQIKTDIDLIKQFLATLPFTLTNGQKRALWDIVKDLAGPRPMNRLLEGDVGSGKTLVALASMLEAMAAGFQTVLLAPTEILARQHYEVLCKYLQSYPYVVSLLTRNFHLANDQNLSKANLLEVVAEGDVSLVVATHAVLQQGIEFKNLGLVVIDEQHRFGVQQRSSLVKLTDAKTKPHLLSMSATPIPRTLALSVYSDLAISTLTELPKGRQKIVTKIVNELNRDKAYEFIRQQVGSGRQAFVVTPRVEDSDTSTIKSAKAELARLQADVFPQLRLGLIHGKLSGAEKERLMAAFYNRELDILVATSVIEIGIDVPNATIMLIEDADRFGLAQLHQLRGRVGRGRHQSYCLLFTQSSSPDSIDRLNQFSKISDGFKLAELDLKQRGFGSLFGTDQTGFDFKYSQYLTMGVLKLGQQAASDLLKKDASLQKHQQLKQKVDPLLEQIHLE